MPALRKTLSCLPALWLASACGDTAVSMDAAPAPIVTAQISRDLDILFVINNTASNGVQEPLAPGFASFAEGLGLGPGGSSPSAPNLQLGIVSADLGVGAENLGVSNCSLRGDGGRLQSQPQGGTCEAPRDNYIVNRGLSDGTRVVNYDGTLDDTFNCISRLGVAGCAFEQPLESMRRALDGTNPSNQGFLREEAALAVVILADEDDCSVSDASIFDTNPLLDVADSELGFFSKFRCFEFGVQCDPDDPRTPGLKSNCGPREDSPYLVPPSEYVAWLQALKERKDMALVFGFTGGIEPVLVGLDGEKPTLRESCSGIHGISPPAIRLHAFLQGGSGRGAESKCQDDYADSLADIAQSITTSMAGLACVSGPLRDTDIDTPGVQPDCEVASVANLGRADEERTILASCANSAARPCYRFEEAETRCGVGRLALVVDGPADSSGVSLSTIARCEGVL